MIELQTSNENALALYSLLSEGQRNGIRVNGTVMFRYKNTPANFWSSKAWNNVAIIDFMDNQKQVAKLRKKINEYCNI